MFIWWPVISAETATILIAVAVGLPVGLLAAYSFMLHRRRPTPPRWWAARLLLWPLLCLGALAAATAHGWRGEEAAFYTALSSLLGQGVIPAVIGGLRALWTARFGGAALPDIAPDLETETGVTGVTRQGGSQGV